MKTRPLKRTDLPFIVEMDAGHGWTEEQFYRQLRRLHCRGLVVVDEVDDIPTAFVVYETLGSTIEIVCIHADDEETEGAMLLNKLKSDRRYISIDMNESNLEGHLFLKSMGFRAIGITPDLFGDGEAGYQFVYAPSLLESRGVKEFYEERHGNR